MSLQYILCVYAREITFGKTEIVNGIQQVGFSNAVGARNSNDPFSELHGSMPVILELNQGNAVEPKHASQDRLRDQSRKSGN